MENRSTGAKNETPVSKDIDGDTDDANPDISHVDSTANGTARARWTLLRQVLRQKQVDCPEVKQVSVRRFSSFDLFSRKRLLQEIHDPSNTSEDQWVEYRSVSLPKYSALLRVNLGPLKVNEVLNSFDNTGNVYLRVGHSSVLTSQMSGSELKTITKSLFTACDITPSLFLNSSLSTLLSAGGLVGQMGN